MKFTYNPRIIKHLGTELITSDEIAITELIKNSYDAEADKVRIQFLNGLDEIKENELIAPVPDQIRNHVSECEGYGLILLEDSGYGMDYSTLESGFFEVGYTGKVDQKQEHKESENDEESIILGDKGIGRLSAQRLAPILFVETTTESDDEIFLVKIHWEDFINSKDTIAPEWSFQKNNDNSYTRLWLCGNESRPLSFEKYLEHRTVSQSDIFGNQSEDLEKAYFVNDELQTALSFLYSPFSDDKTLIDIKVFFNGKNVKTDFSYDTLKIAESIHSFNTTVVCDEDNKPIDLEIEMKMKIRPWFIERIHHNSIGKVLYQDWKREHKEYRSLLQKYQENYDRSLSDSVLLSDLIEKKKWDENYLEYILKIVPIIGELYSFKRDNFLMAMASSSASENGYLDESASINVLRPFLDAHNGIKLYRNDFRIGTIGNKDDDWLELQQKRTKGQQFYRFELGNVIGFIRINDPYQDYIYETSSREDLTENKYVESLEKLLDHVIDVFSPGFNKRAVEITKDILDQEGLIPENDSEDIQNEVNRSQEVLKAAKQNIEAIKEAFDVIAENIELDTDEKRESVKKILTSLKPVADSFEENIEDTQRSFAAANKALLVAQAEKKRIEVEAYNNYKLMANGLITEVITHELHSLLSDASTQKKYEHRFEAIKSFLFEVKNYELNKEHLEPLHRRFKFLYAKMNDLGRFYSFLEKTFIYQGNSHDFETVDIASYLHDLETRFAPRLRKNGIVIDYSGVSGKWYVPKGSLMHLFYNLIDNSIYWIQDRQKRAKHDATFEREQNDKIVIKEIDESTIHFFDTGTGVLEKYQHVLFNPLESGKENGRGMGLYIVRNFLRSFGAEIELLPATNEYDNRYILEVRLNRNNQDDE